MNMETTAIARAGTQPSQKGPAEYFTGSVRIEPLFQPKDAQRCSGAYVTFEPCARSNWHTHPLGQTLIVTFGIGRVQTRGRADSGDQTGRRHLDSPEQTPLARRRAHHRNDPPRHPRVVEW